MMNPFPEYEADESLAGRFEARVREAPQKLAFRQNGLDLSYGELNQWSNRMAHALLTRSREPAEPVVLLLGAPIHHAVAQLGVLKAGKACVPIDVSFPPARQSQIVTDSGARLLITESENLERAADLSRGGCHVSIVDELGDNLSIDNPGLRIDPRSFAYILYTSGSTGSPKGIMQNHCNLLRVAMLYHQDLGIGPADRVTSPTKLAYTGTVWALHAALMNGAAFVCTSFDSPTEFVRSLANDEVTVAQLIVTLLRQLMQTLNEKLELPNLRAVYTGGETLHREDVERFARIFPGGCRLLYNYGSTEAGIITHHHVDLRAAGKGDLQRNLVEAPFPVGYPVKDTEVYLADENGAPMPEGQDGEITVRSRHMSPGYWRDVELTRRHFLAEPPAGSERVFLTGDLGRIRSDGCVIYLGRKDRQVKVRGYRVNLGEIEEALRSIKGIAAAAVMAAADRDGKTRIIAYVQRENRNDSSIGELRQRLAATVPTYMIPSRFHYLDRLPVAANGKLDRSALPRPGHSRPELDVPLVEPRTLTEKALCRIYSEVLNIEPVGVLDNFLHLGGDSLAAFRLIARIETLMDMSIPPKMVFNTHSIEKLARAIDECAP